MHRYFASLTKKEIAIFKKLDNPQKIQDFLETQPINFEESGETLLSPRKVLEKRKMHCFEGALLASAMLWYRGQSPLILDLETVSADQSHVVAIFKHGSRFGAVSKTNHAQLRYRDPVYKTIHELALSYFHEYFLDNGQKTLRSYALFDLRKIKRNWIIDENNLWYVDQALNRTKHILIISKNEEKTLRPADGIERKAGKLVIWRNRNK